MEKIDCLIGMIGKKDVSSNFQPDKIEVAVTGAFMNSL
jgi:hypothetical protein